MSRRVASSVCAPSWLPLPRSRASVVQLLSCLPACLGSSSAIPFILCSYHPVAFPGGTHLIPSPGAHRSVSAAWSSLGSSGPMYVPSKHRPLSILRSFFRSFKIELSIFFLKNRHRSVSPALSPISLHSLHLRNPEVTLH